MLSQRARVAGSRAEYKPSNGPLRVRGTAFGSVCRNAKGTRQRPGDVLASCKGHGMGRETKVAPRISILFVLDRWIHSVKDDFLFRRKRL